MCGAGRGGVGGAERQIKISNQPANPFIVLRQLRHCKTRLLTVPYTVHGLNMKRNELSVSQWNVSSNCTHTGIPGGPETNEPQRTCLLRPPSALVRCWFGDRKGIRPVKFAPAISRGFALGNREPGLTRSNRNQKWW